LNIPDPIQQHQDNNNSREFFVAEKINELKIISPQSFFAIPIIIQYPKRENNQPKEREYAKGIHQQRS
jgi:hypothetical protein